MRHRYVDRRSGRPVTRGVTGAVLFALVAAGCDSGPAELAREIDAARGGCTEEMLKAADEECVRMFERYADMAAGAMETYIGGMRAFDEAVRRRGGLQFDTAGLGNALSDGWRATVEPSGGAGYPVPPTRQTDPWAGAYDPTSDPYYAGSPYGPVSGGRWSDPVPGAGEQQQPYAQEYPADERAAPAAGGGRAPAGRRGVLLPPEERLQRPWIDDGGADDRYVQEERSREQAGTWQDPGAGWWYPYPNGGAPGGYPYGASGSYPYPYGPPAVAPSPYGGTGSAYPYPQPGPGVYPYPDGRPGGW